MSHTPGPWFIATGWIGAGHLRNDPRVIARVDGFPYGDTEANAFLIAAAPELLDALTSLLDATPTSCDDSRLNEAQRQAEAAIRKAQGNG